MKTVIATIKPPHLRNIRSGIKLYEMRKTSPKEVPFRALCCESQSGGMIKAEFICDAVIRGRPEDYPDCVEAACVSMQDAVNYAGNNEACFWHITEMVDLCSTKGRRPQNVREYGLKHSPQSWQYLPEAEPKSSETGP